MMQLLYFYLCLQGSATTWAPAGRRRLNRSTHHQTGRETTRYRNNRLMYHGKGWHLARYRQCHSKCLSASHDRGKDNNKCTDGAEHGKERWGTKP